MIYIEDILHYIVDSNIVNEADRPILSSISRQCKRSVALTDKQFNLVFSKLLTYQDILTKEANVTLKENHDTRLPLRQIDRSKTINIVTQSELDNVPYESYKEKWLWASIRFPFSKKLISKIEKIKNAVPSTHYKHKKGTHIHSIKITGANVYHIIEQFKNSEFVIDPQLLDYHNHSKEILDNSSKHAINFSAGKFNNLPAKVIDELSLLNDLQIIDRKIKYGYTVSTVDNYASLSEEIAHRKTTDICVDPSVHSLKDIAYSMETLKRFPIVALIDESEAMNQISAIHQAFDFIDNSRQCALFRVDSSDTYNLNDYIKEHNLNNWVDNNTQIVYIKKSQLPKVLLKSDFMPLTTIGITSYRSNTYVEGYCSFNCDLRLFHDTEKSMFNLYKRKYGNL